MSNPTPEKDAQRALELFADLDSTYLADKKPGRLLTDVEGLPAYILSDETESSRRDERRIPVNEVVTISIIESSNNAGEDTVQQRPRINVHFNVGAAQMPQLELGIRQGLDTPYTAANIIALVDFPLLYNGNYSQDRMSGDIAEVIQTVQSIELPVAGKNSEQIDQYIAKVLIALRDLVRNKHVLAKQERARQEEEARAQSPS